MDKALLEQLIILGQLYKDGIITKDELEAEKRKLMDISASDASADNEDDYATYSDGEPIVDDDCQVFDPMSVNTENHTEHAFSEPVFQEEKANDSNKFHLPTWVYVVIPLAVLVVVGMFIFIEKYSKSEEAYIEEEIVEDVPAKVIVDNSMTLDQLFCDEHVGDTIVYFECGGLTGFGEYPEGPIVQSIYHANYVECECMGPRIGMSGVIRDYYKGRANTYYCDGCTSAGPCHVNLVWVYDSETRMLSAYRKYSYSTVDFHTVFKKHIKEMHNGKYPDSFIVGKLHLSKAKSVNHTFIEYDEYLGGPDCGEYVAYTVPEINVPDIGFDDDHLKAYPLFDDQDKDDWLVALFTDRGYSVSFFMPSEAFYEMQSQYYGDEFLDSKSDPNNKNVGYTIYAVRDDPQCHISFVEHANGLYEIVLYIPGVNEI